MKQTGEALLRVCRYAAELVSSQFAWLLLLAALSAAMQYAQVNCMASLKNPQGHGGACLAIPGAALFVPLILPLAFAYFHGVLQVFWVRTGSRRGSLGRSAFWGASPRWWEDFGVALGVGLSLLFVSFLLLLPQRLLTAKVAVLVQGIVLAALSLYAVPALADSRGFRESFAKFWGGLLSGERAAAWTKPHFWALAFITPLFGWFNQFLSRLLFGVVPGRLFLGPGARIADAYYLYVGAFLLIQVPLSVAALVAIYRYFWLAAGESAEQPG
jgi:hypothetical protein